MQNNKHPLKGLRPTDLFVYKGINVKVLIGGYEIFGKKVITPEGVDKIIELGYKSIEKSIAHTELSAGVQLIG